MNNGHNHEPDNPLIALQNEALVAAQADRQLLLDRYTNLFDFAPIGYLNLDECGGVLLSNVTCATMIAWERAKLVGRRFELFVAEPDRRAFRDFLATVFASDEKKVCELQMERVSGKLLFVRLEAICSTNRTDCLVAVMDITQRKLTEESLRQAQKMEAISQLAGGIAHDFNNILTVIEGYAGVMLMETPDSDPWHEPLKEICSASAHAAYLTRQLLAFSKRQVLRPESLDLNAMVLENNAMLQRLIGRSVALDLKLDPKLHPVWVERGQVSQILMNLVIHARDAFVGSGTILIQTSNADLDELTLTTETEVVPGGYALLTVSVTGCGMSEADMGRIFKPFLTTARVGQGTGIGLATVQNIVTRSGGHIEVSSEVGEGTTFSVYLPQLKKPSETQSSSLNSTLVFDSTQLLGGNQVILLVEDDDSVRQLATTVLTEAGYSVLSAPDGVEALRLVAEPSQKIDLLFTDMAMPEMDGTQLAELVTQLRPGIRVLKMSGYISDPATRKQISEENVGFIQKPFSPRDLVLKVMSLFPFDTVNNARR